MESFTLPLLPLRGFVVFPGQNVNFDVQRGTSRKSLEQAVENGSPVLLGFQKKITTETPELSDLYPVAASMTITKVFKEERNLRVLGEVGERYLLTGLRSDQGYYEAQVVEPELSVMEPEYEEMLCRVMKNSLEDYAQTTNLVPQAFIRCYESTDAAEISDTIIANIPGEMEDKIPFLLECDPSVRSRSVIERLEKEKRIYEMRRSLHSDVNRSLHDLQKESFLREEMNVIARELGDDPEQESDADIEALLNDPLLPEAVREHIGQEYKRLSKFPPMSQEYSVVRDYLDRVLQIPWHKAAQNGSYNLNRVRSGLDATHYGMKRIKERIVEYAAARNMNPNLTAPVICLVGPPGIGKTSIVSAVAEVLRRPYVRVSLGGVRDEAEIRGHRKTYIGAMPGRIVNAMIQAKASNPVMLLDEIDKMASDLRGDPTAALLEVLDSSINHEFRDAYLELPVDLSDVFFITTANSLEGIPLPLFDRMEIIELESYSLDEKAEIARHYLIPRQRKTYQLSAQQIRITDEALESLIMEYTREAGVRELERLIGSLCRKAVVRLVNGEGKSLQVTRDSLASLMDEPPIKEDREALVPQVGLVHGLAWTPVGGDVLCIETVLFEGSGKLELTGQMGDVMKESAQIALSVVRGMNLPGCDAKFFKEHDLHIHIPAGAVSKDGPSAGVTLSTAIYSALTGKKVRGDIAMTGEISLRSRVLPIGGLKEKLLAAKRRGMKLVFVPLLNREDVAKLPADVTEGMEIRFVSYLREILSEVILKEPEGGAEA